MTDLPHHPGTIVYLDGDELVDELPVDEIPEGLRFAADEDDVMVPVVKVVAHTCASGRELLEYGPEDQLLRVTVQRRER